MSISPAGQAVCLQTGGNPAEVAINAAGTSGYVTISGGSFGTGVLADFSITPPSCNYSISPTSQNFPASGGSGSVNVTTTANCTWSITGVPSWITITSGNGGTGSGIVNFSVAVNSSTNTRSVTLMIAERSFVVTQAGNCATTTITTGQVINGALSTTDCQSPLRNGSYADRFTFAGTAGQ